jgi:hypothetical protein
MHGINMFRGLEITFSLTTIILLLFVLPASIVSAQELNSAPIMQNISPQYILEGERHELNVSATDPDDDNIILDIISKPTGAEFTDNGNGSGTFIWTAAYTGPNSSENSPIEITFRASDGQASTIMAVELNVINNNRNPYMVMPDTIVVQSGSYMEFEVYGYDPDFDQTSWNMLDIPEGLIFEDGNPGKAWWLTSYSDSGYHNAIMEISDIFGASDTSEVVLNVLQTEVFSLSIDTTSVYPGEVAELGINLMNLEEVAGLNLLINYDPSVLTLIDINKSEGRIDGWEYFTYATHVNGLNGDVRITATADIGDDTVTPSLAPGDGPIIWLTFQTSFDLNYAGFSAPVNFVFRDVVLEDDNTMTSPDGEKITQDMINYDGGYIRIKDVSLNTIGDVNLNGVVFEIGDAIYLTNFFINPIAYPLSPVQLLNSDVNRDGYGGTIADLVYLINALLSLNYSSNKIPAGEITAEIFNKVENDKILLAYESEIELGGLHLILKSENNNIAEIKLSRQMELAGMKIKYASNGNLTRLIIYSDEGYVMPSGIKEFLEISNNSIFDIREIQLSSIDGYLIEAAIKDGANAIIPGRFMLYQNFPNPFNPFTEIKFELPKTAEVSLKVFDILGREVISLSNGLIPAGEHKVVWNGRDNLGRPVGSGIYFYLLQSENFSDKKKMILLK